MGTTRPRLQRQLEPDYPVAWQQQQGSKADRLYAFMGTQNLSRDDIIAILGLPQQQGGRR